VHALQPQVGSLIGADVIRQADWLSFAGVGGMGQEEKGGDRAAYVIAHQQ